MIPVKDLIQRKRTFALLLVCCVFSGLVNAQASAGTLKLAPSTAVSSEGFLTLSWSGSSAAQPAVLEIATDRQFGALHRSFPLNLQILQQSQIHISGFGDGTYYARLVDDRQQVLSDSAEFRVVHRNITVAWLLFTVGALLFVTLMAVVIGFAAREAGK